jgi:hypothetical protein
VTLIAPQKLAHFSSGNPKPAEFQHAEVLAAHERLKDRDPRELTPEDFASIGHQRRNLLAVIRENCIQCQGGNAAEVRRCRCTGCSFWPYRMSSNPLRSVSEAQREAGRRNMHFLRSGPGLEPAETAQEGVAGVG